MAGSRSTTGGAIVANDMHLELPAASSGFARRSSAWGRWLAPPHHRRHAARHAGHRRRQQRPGRLGFTNSYGDYLDLITLERDPQNPLRFKTPSGWETATAHSETLQVKGAADESMTVLETSLGPVWSVGVAPTPCTGSHTIREP